MTQMNHLAMRCDIFDFIETWPRQRSSIRKNFYNYMLVVIGAVEVLLMVQIGILWWRIVLVIVVVLSDRVVFLLLLTGRVLKGIAPRWT